MTPTEQDALDYGYNRGPNNSQHWYAGDPNILEAPSPMDVRIENGTDRPVVLSCRAYGGGAFDVLRFESWDEYVTWLKRNGHPLSH